MIIYAFVLVMTLIGSLGAFFFKRSTSNMEGIFSLIRSPWLYVGGVLYVASALMNVVLLRFMDYTILYPMTAITYIWSLIVSNRFLGEKITVKKVAGVALICLGVVLLVK